MTIANVAQRNARGLPQDLRTAQEAIHLPEVQEMLRKLSEYKLGIFMPHMHNEQTGEFQSIPDEIMQVESGLKVSFQPTKDRFLPVGWFWRSGAAAPLSVCEMVAEERSGDTERYGKHTM